MKRLFKIIGGVIGGIIGLVLLVIIVASVAIYFVVTKQMVEDQMKKALHRHVQIQDISVGILSIVSGIEVKGVVISNYKTDKQLEALKGKPVPATDRFVAVNSLKLRLKFLPLIKEKRFELSQLTLHQPSVNVVKFASGAFNFDDLLQPKKLTAEEQAELKKKQAEEAKQPSKPLTADDIPVAINIGKVGMENATVTYFDQKLNQTFQLYGLTAMVRNITVDSKDLAKKNHASLDITMGIKTMGKTSSGSVKSFDIKFVITGGIIPFDVKTRRLDPEVSLDLSSPDGQITGLQIFDKITTVEPLGSYLGKHLDFLKGTTQWKGSKMAKLKAWYKGGAARLSEGNINAKELQIYFDGTTNTNTKSLNVNLTLELHADRSKTAKVAVRQQVESGFKKLGITKYVKADQITEAALRPLLNEKGLIYLKFKVGGTYSAPAVQLVHPPLQSMDQLIKSIAGDVLKEAGKELIQEGVQQLMKGKLKLPKLF